VDDVDSDRDREDEVAPRVSPTRGCCLFPLERLRGTTRDATATDQQ
jgi:hypothetical protein